MAGVGSDYSLAIGLSGGDHDPALAAATASGPVPPPEPQQELLESGRVVTLYPPGQRRGSYHVDVFEPAAYSDARHLLDLHLGLGLGEAFDQSSLWNRAGASFVIDYDGRSQRDWALRQFGATSSADIVDGELQLVPHVPPRTAYLETLFANRLAGGDAQGVKKVIDVLPSLGQERLVGFTNSLDTWKSLQSVEAPHPVRMTGLYVLPDARTAILEWLHERPGDQQAGALPEAVLEALIAADPRAAIEALAWAEKMALVKTGGVGVGFTFNLKPATH